MEELLKQLLTEIQGLKEVQDQIINRLDNLQVENIEGQATKNSSSMNALTHQVEELNAKYDELLNVTARKDSIMRLSENINKLAADMTFLVRKARNAKLISSL